MIAIEFRLSPDGTVFYQDKGQQERKLTMYSKEIIDNVVQTLQVSYPKCFTTLEEMYLSGKVKESVRLKGIYHLVDRFVRCNFGEHDLLSYDLEDGLFKFEEVKCPLRGGICPHENVICKPKRLLHLTTAEKQIADLYVTGMTYDKIATAIGKNPNTVRTILHHIKVKLKVTRSRDIIGILQKSIY